MIYVFAGNETFLKMQDDVDPHQKIAETIEEYPRESQKYLQRGLKIVEADNYFKAKEKAQTTPALESSGQYNIL